MKRYAFLVVAFLALWAVNARADGLLRWVDPTVGTGQKPNKFRQGDAQCGQTFPAVLMPYGMNFWTPQTEDSERKGLPPYYYSSTRLQGFRNSHFLSGSCTQDYGSATLMTMVGELRCMPEERAVSFDHANEFCAPDYYAVSLPEAHLKVEMTGTSRTAIFRFTYTKAGQAWLVVNPNSDEALGSVTITPERGQITGSNPIHRIYQGKGEEAGYSGYFLVETKKSINRYGVFSQEGRIDQKADLAHKPRLGAYIGFEVEAGETVMVKMSSSFCDVAGARRNMEAENKGWDFDATRAALAAEWERTLGAISVESPDTIALSKFYTALYHASFLPHAIQDVDGRYPSFAGGKTISHTEGNYFDDYSLWDTYRALHPLLTLVRPKAAGEMIESLLDKYDAGGWLPIFPCWNSYTSEMIGDHAASLIADAYVKGIRNFDVEKAYRALHHNAFDQPLCYADYADGKGRRALTSYLRYGYIPLEDSVKEAYHKAEQVSRTLEYAYDDYAFARFAEALGRDSVARELYRRSGFWRNVIDPRTGYAQGRHADGTFLNENNAFENATFITEGWPCHYTWYVPHDIAGLMKAMGGKKMFAAKLDSMFTQERYWHGNEPCHQVAFLFNEAGQPKKTQQYVRHILNSEYRLGSDGLSGNDDAGQMSAWYVFAALGFYPVCPASGRYELAAPSFQKAVIKVGDGRTFTIRTRGADPSKGFVRRMWLNGKPYKHHYLRHEDIARGGVLDVFLNE